MNEEKKESIDYLLEGLGLICRQSVEKLGVMLRQILHEERGIRKVADAMAEAEYAEDILTKQAEKLAERNGRQKI